MFSAAYYSRLGIAEIRRKVRAGERLSKAEGEALFACPDLLAVGALAHHCRVRRHGLRTFFVRNRQINYSNICETGCRFCAFSRREGQEGAFTLSREEIVAKALDDGGQPFAEIHLVGGCHPSLRLEWFEDLFQALRRARPQAVLKALTVTEVAHLAALHGCDCLRVLERLRAAGVQMLTGGGAEIFAPDVRRRICPEKISGEEYLRIAGEAHALGLASNCTMLFGHLESAADRVDHLLALREQQDRSRGFLCFIPLPFQARNNPLARSLEGEGRSPDADAGLDCLRTIAVARLLLDNIPHIKAYWIMLGIKLAQAALSFGADDLDGTIEEERIGRMAGANAGPQESLKSEIALTRPQLEAMILGCGFEPVNRDALFRKPPDDPASPPLPPSYAARERAALSRDPCAPPDRDVAQLAARLQAAWGRLREASPPDGGGAAPPPDPERRLSRREASLLYRRADLFTLGALAHKARLALHPEPVVTYVADRNINYSNICACGCRFCAFYRPPGQPGGFVLDRETLDRKLRETLELGGDQILLQGGHNPDLPLSFYEEMLSWMRAAYPGIHLHAFSPPEIVFFARREGLDVDTVLARLKAAGLASIPGGGAEILADAVRARVSPRKCSAGEWLEVMAKAHRLGLKTTATMMFGHEEEDEDRLEHLFSVRDQQDATGGFTAFIPWTFQPDNTALRRPPETAQAYLRLLAVSRLVLDNVPNLQVSWVTMGPQVAQLAILFGANDFGSLMMEENVVAAAGVSFRLSRRQIHSIIRRAGFCPRRRRMDYSPAEGRGDSGLARGGTRRGKEFRLGRIGYLNVLPIYHGLECGAVPHGFELVSGPPAALNALMAKGRLLASSTSSLEYARRPERYFLLPNLAIAGNGPIQSVLLLSRVPLDRLEGRTILASPASHTSVALLRLLLRDFFPLAVYWRTGAAAGALASSQPPDAFLAIGDEALRLRRHPDYPYRLDLGEAWLRWTGLPFVFGLWVADRSRCAALPREVHPGEILEQGRDWGLAHMDKILDAAQASPLPLSRAEYESYFGCLSYTLDERQRQGLLLFWEKLAVAGEIAAVPPLRFL